MSKIIIALTFTDHMEIEDAKINKFIDKLWQTTGFEA